MLDEFYMNGLRGKVRFVYPDNDILIDRTLAKTVGVTDPDTMTIYLSNELRGSFLTTVVLHELSHAMMISYGYLEQIHRYCKKRHWVDMEELIANLIAQQAKEIFQRAYALWVTRQFALFLTNWKGWWHKWQ